MIGDKYQYKYEFIPNSSIGDVKWKQITDF